MCVDDIPIDIVLRKKKGLYSIFLCKKKKPYMNKMLFDEKLPLKINSLKGEMNNKNEKN